LAARFFEISGSKEISEEQTNIIKKHLNLVFVHEIDPSMSDDPNHQQKLNNIHNFGDEPHFMNKGNGKENARC